MAIEAVIFDWEGTTIDYGGRATLLAFQRTFASFGVKLSESVIRRDMALGDLVHIYRLLKDAAVRDGAAANFGTTSIDDLAVRILAAIKRTRLAILPTSAQLKPGVRELIAYLEANHIPYGTTSSGDPELIPDLLPLVAVQGFRPHVNITTKDVEAGRPEPSMNRLAMAQLGVQHPARTIILGDTLDDIRAAQAAGTNAVGVIEGASLLGLAKDQWLALTNQDRQQLRWKIRREYAAAGADLIVNNARDLVRLMQSEATMAAK